ncbi:MAG TPA: family 43 glycosylhydrolase [Virgibacillus sp.]|nr:family 43 glycosylhydrolase [Virgibacillus sp.]HLR68107.1 family 43 glycosylhydrolase [Virgibacillus sp.]
MSNSESAIIAKANKLYIPYRLYEGDKIPTSIDKATVIWNSEPNVVSDDGIINSPNERSTDVKLTAKVIYNALEVDKVFHVKVMSQTSTFILGYTRSTDVANKPGEMEDNIRAITDALHLAYSHNDGKTYTPLHNNTGILFPLVDFNPDPVNGETKVIQDPYIFRMKDGTFGIVATRTNVDKKQTKAEKSSILFFTSDDLITYKEVGLVSLNTDLTASNPVVEVDALSGSYRMEWTASNGDVYYNTTSNFTDVSQPKSQRGYKIVPRKPMVDIKYAVPGNQIAVSDAEAKAIINKFSRVINTKVSDTSITVKKDEEYTFEDLSELRVVASYNDGSTAKKPVQWSLEDYQNIDFGEPGTYIVNGEIIQHPVYPQDWIADYADPNIYRYNGKYYFIATNDMNNNSTLDIRVADTIDELKDAEVYSILTAAPEGEDMSYCLWAPELHEVGGKLYIFFAAGVNDGWQVQARVMELKEGGNPINASDWKEAVRVVRKDGSELSPGGITLDMTTFEDNGVTYVAWSDRVDWGATKTMIATIDPNKPWVLTSEPVQISISDYGWDRRNTPVNEGPYIVKNEGKIYMAISGSAIDNTYSIGFLIADVGNDLIDPKSWEKVGYPSLTSEFVQGYYGTGHNSFAIDQYGQVLNVYHARPEKGGRSSTIRIVHFSVDGTPVLDMTPEREILPENRLVTALITIKNK